MNEQITREAMKKEAERRIKMLNLHPNAVQEFIEEGRLNRSDRTRIVSPFGKHLIGALFWLNDAEKQMVAQIEKEWDIYVYHMTHESFEFGECYDMLYVSRYSDEWEADRMDLKDGFLSYMSVMRQLRIYLNSAISASKPLAAVSSVRCRKGLTP